VRSGLDALFGHHLLQFAALIHFGGEVATACEFTVYFQIGFDDGVQSSGTS
jgi:hypothetical protein